MQTDLVYIVEDDSIAGYLIKLELDSHAAFNESKAFMNGQEAIDHLTTEIENNSLLPDLILLDINMPIMDGWEFLDAFSKLACPKKISIVILTSSINPEDKEKSENYNAVKGFMSKPLVSEKLDKIMELL
jgi:CheY-like chemotaxis protein